MNPGALFSGGKDSLSAVDIVQKQGINVNRLITKSNSSFNTLVLESPLYKKLLGLKLK